ncbi:prefoldin beta damian containing protein [Aphelenchoides avenae]|nr:prefoldin beta damian containing protein [Aphelenchus avenae]
MTSKVEELKSQFEEEVKKLKQLENERERYINNRQQLDAQLAENNMVKEEMERLEPDANVYKLIGPVLVKQDLEEAKLNVNKRIEYISTEIKRMESSMTDINTNMTKQRETIDKSREALKKQLGAA